MLLTELAIDSKDFTIFDISPLILVRERELNFGGKFKCYMDNETKEFFVEVNSASHLQAFNKSVVLNMLDVAEKAGAEKFYICIRNDIKEHSAFLKAFGFIGFRKLKPQEQKNISMTMTHTLIVYNLKDEGEL